MHLILASNSPRRRELLRAAGFEFQVCPSSAAEIRGPGENAENFALRAAREKALQVAASSDNQALVLAADTVVVVDETILGKPGGPEDALRMLRMLSGGTHRVLTGVCLARPLRRIVAESLETTLVTFRRLEEKEIEEYVSSGEPLDKAGAYGIQGLASKFITRIEGCYFNVVGLPVALVYDMLKPFLVRGHLAETGWN